MRSVSDNVSAMENDNARWLRLALTQNDAPPAGRRLQRLPPPLVVQISRAERDAGEEESACRRKGNGIEWRRRK
jgi:hypothetical protein